MRTYLLAAGSLIFSRSLAQDAEERCLGAGFNDPNPTGLLLCRDFLLSNPVDSNAVECDFVTADFVTCVRDTGVCDDVGVCNLMMEQLNVVLEHFDCEPVDTIDTDGCIEVFFQPPSALDECLGNETTGIQNCANTVSNEIVEGNLVTCLEVEEAYSSCAKDFGGCDPEDEEQCIVVSLVLNHLLTFLGDFSDNGVICDLKEISDFEFCSELFGVPITEAPAEVPVEAPTGAPTGADNGFEECLGDETSGLVNCFDTVVNEIVEGSLATCLEVEEAYSACAKEFGGCDPENEEQCSLVSEGLNVLLTVLEDLSANSVVCDLKEMPDFKFCNELFGEPVTEAPTVAPTKISDAGGDNDFEEEKLLTIIIYVLVATVASLVMISLWLLCYRKRAPVDETKEVKANVLVGDL